MFELFVVIELNFHISQASQLYRYSMNRKKDVDLLLLNGQMASATPLGLCRVESCISSKNNIISAPNMRKQGLECGTRWCVRTSENNNLSLYNIGFRTFMNIYLIIITSYWFLGQKDATIFQLVICYYEDDDAQQSDCTFLLHPLDGRIICISQSSYVLVLLMVSSISTGKILNPQ